MAVSVNHSPTNSAKRNVVVLTNKCKLLVVDIVALLEDGKVAVAECEQGGRRQLAACT